MLIWSHIANRFSIEKALIASALIFAVYMFALSQVISVWQVYALTIVNGCAASAILSLPISYFQNLIKDRPGLSTTLISINGFVANSLRAMVFALATLVTNYQGVMFVGGIMFIAGAAVVFRLEQTASPPSAL